MDLAFFGDGQPPMELDLPIYIDPEPYKYG